MEEYESGRVIVERRLDDDEDQQGMAYQGVEEGNLEEVDSDAGRNSRREESARTPEELRREQMEVVEEDSAMDKNTSREAVDEENDKVDERDFVAGGRKEGIRSDPRMEDRDSPRMKDGLAVQG